MALYLIIGCIFAPIGIAVMIGCFLAHQAEAIMFGLIFGGTFAAIGIIFICIWFKEYKRKKTIISNGEKVWGTIVDYTDDTSLYINDIPALDIIVRCYYGGENKVCRLKTEQTKESKFPLGASILLSVYQGQVVFIKNSVGGNAGAV